MNKKQLTHTKNIMRALKSQQNQVKKDSYDRIVSDAVSPNGGVQPFGFGKTANRILTSNEKKNKFRF